LAAAAGPQSQADPNAPKRPAPTYGLEPQVRKSDERDFTKNTKVVAVEVFKDPNSGSLIYLSEMGFIAAAPMPAGMKDAQGLSWSHAMSLKARKGGEKEFANAAKFGIEVFIDKNTGYLVYVCETGSIAVVPKK
jgi:hypothetical protein